MPTIVHTDVLVLGGGSAGVASAVAAAGEGLDITLIERNAFPGGKATAAEVGTVCGLYKFSKAEGSSYIVKGFAKQFAEALRTASGTAPLHNSNGLHYLPYDIGVFKSNALNLLQQNKIKAYFNSIPCKVNMTDHRIDSILVAHPDKDIQFNFKSIIDCSGESIISQLTDSPVIKSENYQAAAQVFSLMDVEEENEDRLGMILMKELKSAIDNKVLDDYFDRVYIVQGSLKNKCVSLKLGLPLPVTLTAENREALKKMGQSFAALLTAHLVQHVPVFKHASIKHLAPEVGIRVGFRTEGNYILTEEDVLQCRKFDDAIANAAWPVEIWEQDKRVIMRYFDYDDFYQVPAGCLQSVYFNNLFMAGRNISADDGAIASARVMGICLQTGYAAGLLAAGHAKHLPVKETIKKIQFAQL